MRYALSVPITFGDRHMKNPGNKNPPTHGVSPGASPIIPEEQENKINGMKNTSRTTRKEFLRARMRYTLLVIVTLDERHLKSQDDKNPV